jgi:hypothetical protein
MVLLHDPSINDKCVVIFGEGLIGSAICNAFPACFSREEMKFAYNDVTLQREHLDAISSRIAQLRGAMLDSLHVVWAAGKAGFSASEHDTESELTIYHNVLNFALSCVELYPGTTVMFHCVSSAGGLFEGQKHVTSLSKPLPLRPYGRLKQTEEELLLATPDSIQKKIYRLSSVYGFIRKGNRLGLVSTLIYNGANQKVSSIVGTTATLRDYVCSSDIGRYIARVIDEGIDRRDSAIMHLVNGKPTSIYEIKRIIEIILGKKIYIAFHDGDDNSRDITFSPSMAPAGWIMHDIQTSARLVYHDWQQHGGIL